jgi:ethanolamine ammonia-lyase large subunit
VQVLVSDGLSAGAVHHSVPTLLGVLDDALQARGIRVGQPMLVRYGRVKLAEEVSQAVEADVVICLIGERPGGDAHAARSLSAYLVFRRKCRAEAAPAFEYSVISNIHEAGLPPLEAGSLVAEKVFQILAL